MFKLFIGSKNNHIKIRRPSPLILLISIIIVSGSIFLSGCGGGGGGGGSSSNSASVQNVPTSTSTTVLPPASTTNLSNTMNVYLDEYSDKSTVNAPYVNIYINGNATPIPLLLDTGATGIMINQSALTNAGVSVQSSQYNFSGSFADGGVFSGRISYANVSTSISGGLTAQNIPIAVAATDYDFPSAGFLQGDFGMGLSPYYSFGGSINGRNTVFTPSFVSSYLPDNYNNGFILNFNSIYFNPYGYSIISNPNAAPAGTITFGLNTATDNYIPAGSYFYPNVSGQSKPFPMIKLQFGLNTADSEGYKFYSFFDTGSNFIYLGTDAINDSIGSGASTNDVIPSGSCQSFLYGELSVSFGLYDSGGNLIGNTFTTDPDNLNNSFCDYSDYSAVTAGSSGSSAVALNNAVYYGGFQQGLEDFGLPYIFNQPMYWQTQSSISNWGIGIEP